MSLPIPAYGEIIILSVEYAEDGLTWAMLWDNHALGWLVSELVAPDEPPPVRGEPRTARKPSVTGSHAPQPIILGSLAAPAPDTTPVISPQWGKFDAPVVFIPDMGRMLLPDFLTWLATNNGAKRKLGSMLALSDPLKNGYEQWAVMNPDLAFSGTPPEPAPPLRSAEDDEKEADARHSRHEPHHRPRNGRRSGAQARHEKEDAEEQDGDKR
jgi:hypothetical protein